MATYFLTGAAGFIASRVAALLLESGHKVVGVDNFNDAYDARLKEYRVAKLRENPNFSCRHADISDRAKLREAFQEIAETPAAICNLAARAGVRASVENPWLYLETNTTGTLNLLELCREYSVPKFILASTSSLYGAHNAQPYREDVDTDRPLSPYAASKKAAEALAYTYHYLHGVDVSVFRFFTVYGPASRPDMAPFRFVQWISEGRPVTVYGDGSQSRDFTYVDDVARGVVAGLQPLGYEVFNLGCDAPVVLLDMIRTIENLTGKKADLRFEEASRADAYATWASIEKAARVLAWQPQTSFEDGMKAQVDWYQRNRDWAKDVITR